MSSEFIRNQGTLFGHPKALYLLFTTEMWERFSYYGMRALLVLAMVSATESVNPGFGWAQSDALVLYGWYTGLVYFTPMIGGWIADNYLGQRKSIIIGGLLMAIAQFTLAYAIPNDIDLFYVGLFLLIIGNGFFKPNISTMVGDLYEEGDHRRDGAFTIFYMGINLGAFIAPFVTNTLGENPDYGWSYGFFFAGIGMLLSVLIQVFLAPRYLGNMGTEPAAKLAREKSGGVVEPLTKIELERLKVIFMLFIFVVLFWASFEQAGGLMNIYAAEKTDRMVGDFQVPAGWFQSLNPLYIILLAPIFSVLWSKLGSRDPSTPKKMVLGLLLTAVGFLFMVGAVIEQKANGLAGMHWLALAYLFHTMGELCISPVGLSMVTKLSPVRLGSLMMGVWFSVNFVANLLAGIIGSFAEELGEMAIFSGLAITDVVFALILWPMSGMLVRWMHGAEGHLTQEEILEQELESSSAAS